MREKACIVFDLDDVLLDTESNLDWLHRSFQKTLIQYGIKNSKENLQKIHSRNLHNLSEVSKEFNIKKEELWETRNNSYIKEKIRAMREKELVPFNDIKSLYKLKGKYGLAIISDSPQEVVEFFVQEFGLKDLFECLIGRGSRFEDLQKLKPSSFPFNKLIENIDYDKLFYIGDSIKDREFAINNGMEFIFLDRKNGKKFSDLEKVVDYFLSK